MNSKKEVFEFATLDEAEEAKLQIHKALVQMGEKLATETPPNDKYIRLQHLTTNYLNENGDEMAGIRIFDKSGMNELMALSVNLATNELTTEIMGDTAQQILLSKVVNEHVSAAAVSQSGGKTA